MSEWRSEMHRFLSGLKTLAPVVLAVSVLAGASASAAATDSSVSAAPVAEAGVPPGTVPMVASELFALYRDKSWQWDDGAGRMDGADRKFTAWVDGDKGKSWAEGRWLVTDAGRMCLKADWHSDQGVFPARTCFSHRIGNGTIYQKREPDGQWYVFRHTNIREDDEAKKLVSEDLVSSRIDSLRPVPRQKQSMAK
jgi:hypothetical protein